MAPNGKVLVVEMVVPAERESAPSTLLDLNMLVMTGGRERTETDFRRLFDAAGLTALLGLDRPRRSCAEAEHVQVPVFA
jgi:hypothetical protein